MKLSPKMKCLDVKPKCSKQYPKKYGENTGKNMDVATFNKKCIFFYYFTTILCTSIKVHDCRIFRGEAGPNICELKGIGFVNVSGKLMSLPVLSFGDSAIVAIL